MVLLSSSMHNLDALLLVLSKALQFRFRLSKIIISQNQLLKLQETRCTEVIPIIFISKKTFTFLKPFFHFFVSIIDDEWCDIVTTIVYT